MHLFYNGMDALPHYGPFSQTEDELKLFDLIKGKTILDICCGSRHSLLYMKNHGAKELWGLDFSEEQIANATKLLDGFETTLLCTPMEQNSGIPTNHFDIVYSIYAIGWTFDLQQTLSRIYSYLKPGGSFIFSWDHPLYSHLQVKGDQIQLFDSYQLEGSRTYPNFKGTGATMTIPIRKMSTYINALINSGFSIEQVIEPTVSSHLKNEEGVASERYYSLFKAKQVPTTMIIKARK
ncbi:ubiquinone/menaquinone biosynthesis C-methylase UbiE [Alkalihalobacillus xiaoxiensis]|uniref:Ubiquinone/menaquinone biosynthesis C-methylase UbiE n=1 Tax=Shouchella xiaoxiensis TaxID=766895 RepID=A0ABS2SPD2_9BACI|nr:ubiquinone/menaquinone biosynthesis C-methylase UbiE [Shouchella xiaoxiensis]